MENNVSLDKKDNTGVNTVLNTGLNTGVNTFNKFIFMGSFT